MPEVVGDAGTYFDPSSLESISLALEHVLYTKGYADALVQEGLERLAHFSWQRCTDETLAIYRVTGK
jgi:glycosyltransferase involved in cell wall biosynthesis